MTTTSSPDEQMLLEQDRQARKQALDVTRSFLVKAPAGSGKTALLTQRLLALLSVVDKPEDVLAITFTVAATAEMRARVIGALLRAQKPIEPGASVEEHRLATAALEHARSRGWSLLEQPQQLNIQTIDALCLRIAHEAPLLSRLGGQLQPTEDAEPLYALAARRTIEQLGGTNTELSNALGQLLRLRDVSLTDVEKLIANMLSERDQWLEEFSQSRTLTDDEWLALRARREEPLRRQNEEVLRNVRSALHRNPAETEAMFRMFAFVCEDGEPPEHFHALKDMTNAHQLQEMAHFLCVRKFFLTSGNDWRKKTDKTIGFRSIKDGGSRERAQEFRSLVEAVSRIDGLHEALCALGSLPNPAFTDDEWQTIRNIFTVLLRAAAELRVVFAERARIDFVETGITADHALRDPDVRQRWSEKLKHLLVDEFQDTSRRQYTLLKDIVSGWDALDIQNGNRTCFLVGDPMQSIYLFRNAELALFDQVEQNGFGEDAAALQFNTLTLQRNFRSTAGIVEPINAMFHASVQQGAAGAAHFTPALANPDTASENALHLHTTFASDKAEETAALEVEAAQAVEIIRRHMPALEQAKVEGKEFRMGVLVRAKQHIARIAAALREAGIPYRAVELETLQQRQEVRDLLSLLRALTHPMDRIAWLSVLRAPWCGLSLADLHILSGSDDPQLQKRPIPELLATRAVLLSEDGRLRAARVQQTLELALTTRFSGTFSASPNGFATWIERTWTALGGPYCIDADSVENVNAFFKLLAGFPPGGLEASGATLDQRLEKLFAQPDPRAPEKCSVQLMTIHKAKGLGFDVVLVPGLDRTTNKGDSPLLRWMLRTHAKTADRELLIAPIGSKGVESSATYQWIGGLQKQEEEAELHRLLYVAATRARKELHLFARLKLKMSKTGAQLSLPAKGSLLGCGWGYLQQRVDPPDAQLDVGPQLVPRRASQHAGLDLAASAAPYAQSLKRLPATWAWQPGSARAVQPQSSTQEAASQPGRRIGSLASRTRGVVLHALFESVASLAEDHPHRDIAQSIEHWKSVAASMLRHAGLGRREHDSELKAVLSMLQAAGRDPDAQWILGRRPYARSESAWTMEEDGALKILRSDRVFLAGSEPHSDGEDHLWIVDYKTAEEDRAGSFLMEERLRHEPQLLRYAEALREATQSSLPLRLALYYPAIPHLLWWPA